MPTQVPILTRYQGSMSPAKLVDPPIPSSAREKTDFISLHANRAVLDEVLLPLRPVSPPKSARDADKQVRELAWICASTLLPRGSRISPWKAGDAY